MTQIDPKALRSAFGRFMTGVTTVTARASDGTPVGITANSFTSVSLDPPLLLICPGKHLNSFEVFEEADTFAVSILAEGQEHVSNTFASAKGDRFADIECDFDVHNDPLIKGRTAGFSCKVHNKVPAGDHMIIIGEVVAFDTGPEGGLGYCTNGYFSLSSERQSDAAPTEDGSLASVLLEDGRDLLLTESKELPSVRLDGRTGARAALQRYLERLNIEATIGNVYSIYDDQRANEHHIVLRAEVQKLPANCLLKPVAIQDLVQIETDPARGSMFARFAEEHRNQNFTLYIGNAKDGETHST